MASPDPLNPQEKREAGKYMDKLKTAQESDLDLLAADPEVSHHFLIKVTSSKLNIEAAELDQGQIYSFVLFVLQHLDPEEDDISIKITRINDLEGEE